MNPKIISLGTSIFLLCIGIVFNGACAQYDEPEIVPPSLSQDLSLVAPEDFPATIKRLMDIAQNHHNPDICMRARYTIALAYMHYNNPNPDYLEALVNLDKYMSFNTDHSLEKSETAVWHSVLAQMITTIQNCEALQKDYEKLKQQYRGVEKNREFLGQQIQDLAETIKSQRKEIADLEDKIKKLDALHAEIEKKKKKK